jgi:hypothetical protein
MVTNLFTLNSLIYVLLFIIYELGFKIAIINKLEARVKRNILKEQTDIVENVKNVYNEKLENVRAFNLNENSNLKHALDKLLTLQVQHRTEERQALMKFLSNCNQWIFNLSTIKFKHYNINNFSDLKAKIESTQDEFFLNIHAEKIKIILFITNQDVNKATEKLLDTLEIYKETIERNLIELFFLFNQQYSSREEFEAYDDEGPFIQTIFHIHNDEKIKGLSSDFDAFAVKAFKNNINEIENFAIVAKQYLTSLEFNND